MTLVEMPKANENLTEATLSRWLVKVGDKVSAQAPLCEIITDKAKFELPAPESGIVLDRFVEDHSVVPVGYVLCVIGNDLEKIPKEISEKNAALIFNYRGAATQLVTGVSESAAAQNPGLEGIRATPAARRVARELGLDLAMIAKNFNPTGPITEQDVRNFAAK